MQMDIVYNTETECTESQYKELLKHCGGLVATRTEDGKFYFKPMTRRADYNSYVRLVLSKK